MGLIRWCVVVVLASLVWASLLAGSALAQTLAQTPTGERFIVLASTTSTEHDEALAGWRLGQRWGRRQAGAEPQRPGGPGGTGADQAHGNSPLRNAAAVWLAAGSKNCAVGKSTSARPASR